MLSQRKKISLFLVIALLVLAAFFFWNKKNAELGAMENIKKVETAKTVRRTIQHTERFLGVLKSSQSTTLFAKSKGVLHQAVPSGARVKKDDVIATIDDPDIVHRYELSKQTEHLERNQFERMQALQKTGVLTKNAVEDKKIKLIEAEKNLSNAKTSYEELTIKAPFDGVVGVFKVKEGSLMQPNQSIVAFYNPDKMSVEFDVPLSLANQVDVGADVNVRGKIYPLTHIQKMLDEETHMCPAFADIECPQCIAGETLDVEVTVLKKENVLIIPFDAVFLRNGKFAVYVVESGKAALKFVEMGVREKEFVEITEGLKEGDVVITRGQSHLFPDMPVRVK